MNSQSKTPVDEPQTQPEPISDTAIGWSTMRYLAQYADDQSVKLEAAKLLLGIRS